ncbi:MAG: alpha-galactosidase [Verrucomicrobia bacterium]|nr:alpha-galactosidase [Verrucomicrobiota bacterium]
MKPLRLILSGLGLSYHSRQSAETYSRIAITRSFPMNSRTLLFDRRLNKMKWLTALRVLFASVILIGCSVHGEPMKEPLVLTPKPGPQPRINGAKVFGVRPGHPILYTIAATGQRPMKFSATGLPAGARLDGQTGRISGSVAKRGTYRVMLRAENALGRAERALRLVVGDDICLTPLLGCNTWGGWGAKVTDANLRAAAEAMVRLGLINHGWQYINIDDGWQGKRGGKHNAIQPNEKFPDMRALCDYIHGLGLKAGIYSTPWTTSYAGFIGGSSDDPSGAWEKPKRARDGYRYGKHFFETNDARQWAEWGFDYAKYDWKIDSVEVTRRFAEALAACNRDIVVELSNEVPLKLARECVALAQLTRTTGDLVDFWDRSQMDAGLRKWAVGIREVMLEHDAFAPFQRPGHWNHACNLRVGLLGGWRDKPLTPSHLTPDEQYSHISLWCLWSSPMIIGTPIERLDEFTLSLLTNDEVLEINQDPLGKQALRTEIANGGEILVKNLEDGTKAIGIFNPGPADATLVVEWSKLGLRGPQRVRDLWRQKDLGVFADRFETKVPSHGVVLVKLTSTRRPSPR